MGRHLEMEFLISLAALYEFRLIMAAKISPMLRLVLLHLKMAQASKDLQLQSSIQFAESVWKIATLTHYHRFVLDIGIIMHSSAGGIVDLEKGFRLGLTQSIKDEMACNNYQIIL